VRPIRLSHLNLGLLVLMLLLLLGFGLSLRLGLQEMAEASRKHTAAMARQELALATAHLDSRLRSVVRGLAEWDESRQQLSNPEYYALWRDHRAWEAGLLPKSALALALYDGNGAILRPDARMPARGPKTQTLTARYRNEAGRDILYLFFPIPAQADGNGVAGYGGLKLDLLNELQGAGHGRFLAVDRLRVDLADGATVRLAELQSHLEVTPRKDTEIEGLLQAFETALVRLGLGILAIVGLAFVIIHWLLIRPLRALSAEITALRERPLDPPGIGAATVRPLQEIESLRASFNDYHQRLAQMHRELERNSRDYYDQARRDALTGTYNRRAFEEDWSGLEQDKRVSQCTLILFDCDHFKAINDTYSHPVGDRVIRAMASCLTRALRADDRLYRLGGDEFATLMPGAAVDTALIVAERCLDEVRRHDFGQYGITEPVTISIGLAHARSPLDLVTLHKQADLAMYTAKRPGHPKIVVYEDALGSLASLVDNRDVSAVYEAIRQPELLEFRYQPVVRLAAMQQEYAEALCRIRTEGRVIGPGAIFAIVHNRRLDVEFDLAVIRAIRRDLEAGVSALRQGVSINLSAPGMVNDEVIQGLLTLKAAFPERKIVVEITETALISQMDLATANIGRLRQAGCLVALDDFGSGYSSLRYLAAMPVDMVKFDMSLVRLLVQEDLRQRLVVEDVAEMVATAGYELVAEGIETEALLARVIEVGFSHGQGYHLDHLIASVDRQPVAARRISFSSS
jgi:diguanylate cyclase (GGDEF)-like protein